MELFDNELKNIIESKKGVAKEDFNLFYALINRDEARFTHSRKFLEDCFSKIGENQQSIKKRLEDNPYGAVKTINELIVGAYLTNLGYEVEYDREIDNQTPDWWVRDSNGKDVFFLDVRTQVVNLDAKKSSFHPRNKNQLQPKIETKDDVDKKVNKYQKIIESEKIPFLVALVSDWIAGIEMNEMAADGFYSFKLQIEDNWYGFQRQSASEDEPLEHDEIKIGIDIYRKIEKNLVDGIFGKEHLSGILDFKVAPFITYEVSLTLNPNAKFKISKDFFPDTEVLDLVYEV